MSQYSVDWMMELEESDLILRDKEMLELQSYVDYTMIFRILVYVVNTLVKYFLDKDKNVREQAKFRMPAMVPIVFYNGQDRWTAARSLREYQNSGDIFGDYILNLQYYLVDLSEIEEEYILSTNTVLDNIMYCDKYRKRLELAGGDPYRIQQAGEAWHAGEGRVPQLGKIHTAVSLRQKGSRGGGDPELGR